MAKLKPWYSRLGPLSWYRAVGRTEWIRFSLSIGRRNLVDLHWSFHGRFAVLWLLGTVHRRGRNGAPTTVEPRWSFERRFPALL